MLMISVFASFEKNRQRGSTPPHRLSLPTPPPNPNPTTHNPQPTTHNSQLTTHNSQPTTPTNFTKNARPRSRAPVFGVPPHLVPGLIVLTGDGLFDFNDDGDGAEFDGDGDLDALAGGIELFIHQDFVFALGYFEDSR
ncbi:MAG: hypothetical protein D6765_14900 [Bacteroidetes bacterium]|nr:MAG: hypothetical protein D6765_14900 [Bacteroidota bacterium]